MQVPFTTVDVFTDRKFGGNPLAVVTDARRLSGEQMQAVAAEFNLAETTFVLPPGDRAHTAEVRIFTPKAEMPFAGHPNIGTAFVLAKAGKCLGHKVAGDRLVFEEKAGLVAIDLVRDKGEVIATRLAAPQPLTLGDEIAAGIVAEACSLSSTEIETGAHRPIIASCGVGFVMAELKSRRALAAAQGRLDVFRRHLPMERAVGIHLYVRGRDGDLDIQSRMFAPLYGVPEDPATGSANVALIGLLAQLDARADLTLSQTIGQGFDMGRPSILQACAEKRAGKVTATHIGGRCVEMMTGTIEL
jgi:trans-2,3-dihydro-3-hydroxyanthranilate isomerase